MKSLNNADPGKTIFEKIKIVNDEGSEFWSAREFSKILGYRRWESFENVIEKAKESCENSGQEISNHFYDTRIVIKLGSRAQREILDYHLSRYACYLIVQNADPTKQAVALGQTYFAIQTRKQELHESSGFPENMTEEEKRLLLRDEMKKFNVRLAFTAKNAGVVEGYDFAIFQDHGYKGLYGGLGNRDIHERKGLTKNQKILDHMGSTELAANLFRVTQTDEKLKRERIQGKENANRAHHEVGAKVRQTIKELGGTLPEDLPVAESIIKLEKQSKKELK